ncbi:MAG TPA: hypothetical protein VHW23_15995 [Kofleriaceae bacterium]|jgi:hypothetical protein|nr:hypothetical protein [Kofleriaceae bacterium]
MRAARCFALVALAGCARSPRGPSAPSTPVATAPAAPAPMPVQPALPASFAFDLVAPGPAPAARLRLDGAGRPYLVTRDTLVPLARLASGEAAQPFRIAGAAAIGDVAWVGDGVMLFVVGSQLGALDEHGFAPFLELPEPDMAVVAAGPDRCWLFPRGGGGRLYLYERAGTLTEVLHVDEPIRAVSGPPQRAHVAVGSSILRIAADPRAASTGAAELVFDAGEPIVALAAVAPAGVLFSTRGGTFYLSGGAAVTRVTPQVASAIAVHGDDVFLAFDAAGIVHGAPVSALASLPDREPPPVVVAPPPAFSPEEPPRPPPPTPFAFPDAKDFRDLRLSISTSASGEYTTSSSQSGATRSAWSMRLDRTASSGLPGFVWSIGLTLDLTASDFVKPGSTMYGMAGDLGFGYGVALGHYWQLELMPYGEFAAVAVDQPFSSATAWGNGWGLGGRATIAYTFDSGTQLAASASYAMRWLQLDGDCMSCATPGYHGQVTLQSAAIGLVLGKRY